MSNDLFIYLFFSITKFVVVIYIQYGRGNNYLKPYSRVTQIIICFYFYDQFEMTRDSSIDIIAIIVSYSYVARDILLYTYLTYYNIYSQTKLIRYRSC